MYFKASRIILATDGDPPGQALAEELARRVGRERFRNIFYIILHAVSVLAMYLLSYNNFSFLGFSSLLVISTIVVELAVFFLSFADVGELGGQKRIMVWIALKMQMR